MPQKPPTPSRETGLIIQPRTGLVTLPYGGSPALSEIINRSLVHIRTSEALATRQRNPGEECDFEIAPGVKLVMCWIPPGEFLMGSPESAKGRRDDETQHRVRISRGFWLAKTQTTQAQWESVMGWNPSYFKNKNLPVEQVTWNAICGNESSLGGFLEELNARVPTGGTFHLPTEAQWEHACRAGTAGPYAGNLYEMGWFRHNSNQKPHRVGQKKPNAWGLHDMHGNVWEWCSDWYGDYGVGDVTDPSGSARVSYWGAVYRGGSWIFDACLCRAAIRRASDPGCCFHDLGFRLARSSVL